MPHITDAELKADCLSLLGNPLAHSSRDVYFGRYKAGRWLDAAQSAIDCEDFSEYREMLELDAEDEDDEEEVFENFGTRHPDDHGLGFRL